jgi:hypothetical protein
MRPAGVGRDCVAAVDVVPQGGLSALVGSRGLQVVALVAPVAWGGVDALEATVTAATMQPLVSPCCHPMDLLHPEVHCVGAMGYKWLLWKSLRPTHANAATSQQQPHTNTSRPH